MGIWNTADNAALVDAEKKLLSTCMPNTFTQGTAAGLHYVEVFPSSKAVDAEDDASRIPVVLLAGYGGALAWWLFNLGALADDRRLRVFAVDHLGTGASERREFPRHEPSGSSARAEAGEAYFITSLEAWRQSMNLGPMALIGHSMGGYIAGCYAVTFPQQVLFLGLCSPACLPQPLQPSPPPAAGSAGSAADPADAANTAKGRNWVADLEDDDGRTLSDSYVYKTIRNLWAKDYTPHALVRAAGPLGRALVRGGLRRRVSRWVLQRPFTPEQVELMGEYMYHHLSLPASGEYALNAFLYLPPDTRHLRGARPGHFAMARKPMAQRLLGLAESGRAGAGFPVAVTYGGSHDWMITEAGPELVEALNQRAGTEWAHSGLEYLPRSGHHCYLENPAGFNATYLAALGALADRRAAGRKAVS